MMTSHEKFIHYVDRADRGQVVDFFEWNRKLFQLLCQCV